MNLLVVFLLLVLAWKVYEGYHKGMVREIISFVSLIVLCIMAVLLASALQSYTEKEFVGVAVSVLLLVVILIAHHLLGLVFFSAKLISKLPIIHGLDKLLGIAVGVMETVILLWTAYTFLMTFETGMLGQMVFAYTQDTPILLMLYRCNLLADWISSIRENISFLPL